MDDEKLDELFGKDKDESQVNSEAGLSKPSPDDLTSDAKDSKQDTNQDSKDSDKDSEEEKVTIIEGDEDKEDDSSEADKESADDSKVKADSKEQESKPKPSRKLPEPSRIPKTSSEEKEDQEQIAFNPKLMVGIVLATLIITLLVLFAVHPFFRIRKFDISGNHVVTDSELISEMGVEYNDHLLASVSGNIFDVLTLNYGKIEDEIMKNNPYIEDIKIHVKFPSKLVVEVTEREKIAYIKTPDGYIAIDREGTVLEMSSDYSIDTHPLICGLNVNNAVLGEKISVVDDIKFQKMIIVLGAVLAADGSFEVVDNEYSFFDNLSEIRILSSGIYFLSVRLPGGAAMQVKLKEVDSINEKMQWLVNALESGSFDGLPDGVLDMTGDEAIYREYQ